MLLPIMRIYLKYLNNFIYIERKKKTKEVEEESNELQARFAENLLKK